MQLRSRAIICFSFVFFLLIVSCRIAWPWIHATYFWRKSSIESLESHSSISIDPIPRIIHQTYRDHMSIPFQWQQASNTCRTLHPDYEYKFWSDIEARHLIENKFPYLLSTFDSYPYDIQRADVIRLVVLYIYGGIYLDMDIICLKSLDQLLNYQLILPRTYPVGISNDMIIAKPQHPFLLQVLEHLPESNRNYLTKYPTVMFSTGPMFLTREASNYFDRQSIDTLSPELYGKYIHNSSFALFRHLKASSWHGNDVSMIKWIYQRRYLIMIFILCLGISMTMYCFQKHLNTYSSVITEELDTMKIETSSTVKYRKIYQVMLVNLVCSLVQFFRRLK